MIETTPPKNTKGGFPSSLLYTSVSPIPISSPNGLSSIVSPAFGNFKNLDLSGTLSPRCEGRIDYISQSPSGKKIARRLSFNSPVKDDVEEVNADTKDQNLQDKENVAIKNTLWQKISNSASSVFSFFKPALSMVLTHTLISRPSKESLEVQHDELEELLLGTQLKGIVESVSFKIVDQVKLSIKEALKEYSLGWVLDSVLKPTDTTIQELIEDMLLKAYLNIAKEIKANNLKEPGKFKVTVTFFDVTGVLFTLIQSHVSEIQPLIKEINSKKGKLESERILNSLFLGVSNELLAKMFPDGKESIPLWIPAQLSDFLWRWLKDTYLPEVIKNIYIDLEKSFCNDYEKTLREHNGGDDLVKLSSDLAKSVSDIIPDLIQGNDEVIADSVLSLLDIEVDENKVYKKWLLSELSVVKNSSHTKFWEFLGSYAEPLILHVIVHLSDHKIDGMDDASAIVKIVNRLFVCVTEFFNDHQKMIDQLISACKKLNKNPKEDIALHQLFDQLTIDLLKMAGLSDAKKWPMPSFIAPYALKKSKELIKNILLDQYIVMVSSTIDDETSIAKLMTSLHDLKPKEKTLSELTVKSVKTNVVSVSKENVAASLIISQACAKVSSLAAQSFFDYFGLDLSPGLTVSPSKQLVSAYVVKLIKITFQDMASYAIETHDMKASDNPSRMVLSDVVFRVGRIVNRDFKFKPNKAQKKSLSPEKLSSDLNTASTSLVKSLIASFGDTNPFTALPLNGIPFDKYIKDMSWNMIKETLLPSLFENFYSSIMSFRLESVHSFRTIKEAYHTTHPKCAIEVISLFASSYTRHYLTSETALVAETLFDAFKAWITEDEKLIPLKTPTELSKTLSAHKPEIIALLKDNIHHLVDGNDKLNWFWLSFTDYIEGFIAKVFANLSSNIMDVEKKSQNLEVEIAIGLVRAAVEYLRILNGVDPNISMISDGEQEAMEGSIHLNDDFSSALHPALATDPKASLQEKTARKLDQFFMPLSQKLFELADIQTKDFPGPQSMKAPMESLLKEKILPNVFLASFQKLLDPDLKTSLMLTFVSQLDSALRDMEKHKEPETGKSGRAFTDVQKDLNKECGKVVLELVGMIPDTNWVQYPLMRDKLKEMSEGAIGDAMMSYLSRWTFLQMIDNMIVLGLPSIHSGKWVGKEREEKFEPLKAFASAAGDKMELNPVEKFEFDFSGSNDVKKPDTVLKKSEAKEIHDKLKKEMTRTISTQLEAKAWAFIKHVWKQVQERLDDLIEKYFPKNGPRIKSKLDKIFRKIFIDLVGVAVAFLMTPLIKLVKLIIEKSYIDKRSEEVIQSMKKESFEHLLYTWTDLFLNKLLDRKDYLKQSPRRQSPARL